MATRYESVGTIFAPPRISIHIRESAFHRLKDDNRRTARGPAGHRRAADRCGRTRLRECVVPESRRVPHLPSFPRRREDRKSVVEGTSVYVRVDLGGRRIIKK